MIIGITGYKGSGKDTVANIIMDQIEKSHKVHFALPLKRAVQQLFTFSDNQIDTTKEQIDNFWGICPRQALQFVGTDLIRDNIGKLLPNTGDNFFIKCMQRYLANLGHYDVICIPDVRFQNEADFIKQMGGIIIRISRQNCVNAYSNHKSEQELNNIQFDEYVDNTGSVDKLQLLVGELMLKYQLLK